MKNLLFAILLLFLSSSSLFAYIDVGSGLPFLSSLSTIFLIIISFLAALFYPVKIFFKSIKRRKWLRYIIIGIIFIIIFILIFWGVTKMKKTEIDTKVLVIGIDALDPNLLEKYINKGELPNFQKLIRNGDFTRMATVNPPQSPVAWAAFSTGMNPGKTGMFDFVGRDPKTYLPQLEFTDFQIESRDIDFGFFNIPVKKLNIINRRKGEPFWIVTSKFNVPTIILSCPVTFPPDKINGRMLAGMGVPDIRGTEGTFTFFTTSDKYTDEISGGKVIKLNRDRIIESYLPGPVDTSKNKIIEFKLPIRIKINEEKGSAEISIQGNSITLNVNEWSEWVPLKFKIGFLKYIKAICRFYLKSITPELELYCSPLNFDPKDPVFPISYPENYAKKLYKKIGYFYTQGMPYDTKALNANVIDEEVYLQLTDYILNKNKEIFWIEFKKFKSGVFFNYFETLDTLQHMFWRHIDPAHPMYNKKESEKFGLAIEKHYIKFDKFIGDVLNKIDDKTTLIILSDHGFGPFYRACNVNRWLKEKGLLALKEGNRVGKELFQDVDWSKTKAYALGFNSIYINQKGREAKGIVEPGLETEKLKKYIKTELMKWRDTENNTPVMKDVYLKEEIYWGKYINDAPDIVCGFRKGYRASWQTAIGATPEKLIENNMKKWSGSHLFDASEVPASLIVNKKIKKKNPEIIDIAPTILKIFGIKIPSDIDGEPIF